MPPSIDICVVVTVNGKLTICDNRVLLFPRSGLGDYLIISPLIKLQDYIVLTMQQSVLTVGLPSDEFVIQLEDRSVLIT